MSTKRKTLKQKRISDLKKTQITPDAITSPSIPVYTFTTTDKQKSNPVVKITPNQFSYDLSDVRQSLLVSSMLIAINVVIYILVENGVIPLRLIGL